MFGDMEKKTIQGKHNPFYQIMQWQDQAINSIDAFEKMLRKGTIVPISRKSSKAKASGKTASQPSKSAKSEKFKTGQIKHTMFPFFFLVLFLWSKILG